MTPTVQILATVRKPELLKAALLVFRTLRIGFPKAQVKVWGNGLTPVYAAAVVEAAQTCGATYADLDLTSHDRWVEELIRTEFDPFWICDTDIVFFEAVEEFVHSSALMAGRYEPEFWEPWTDTIKVARLHTCVLYLNPGELRSAMRQWICQLPEPWRNSAEYPFIRQHFIPRHTQLPMFYDTCAGLHQALGGERFTPKQNAAFEHLHCATYADQLEGDFGVDMRAMHAEVYRRPAAARGLHLQQQRWYDQHKDAS
jgi:hypothetical protein